MKTPGLPPELDDLLAGLARRGVTTTALERVRLRHLLGVEGALCSSELPALLAALLCKDERQRAALAREYRLWAADYEGVLDASGGPGSEEETGQRMGAVAGGRATDRSHRGAVSAHAGTAPRRRFDFRSLLRYRRSAAVGAAVIGLLVLVWVLMPPPEKHTPPIPPKAVAPGAVTGVQAGPICPQELPRDPVKAVWAWVPKPDYRPWLAGCGGLLLALVTLTAGWRLRGARRRYLSGLGAAGGGERAPRRGLGPMPVHGDLLLDPAERREMVWSIDRYVSEDRSRELDAAATVRATARAGGEPHIVHGRLSFPREVWLWCDRKSASLALQERLVEEVRNALQRANLPVRMAHFYGLPERLVWEDNRESFRPVYHEGAGAQAAVAVVSDGAALVRAGENPGERPLLERLLRELRSWPRLCLVDLGRDQELGRLAAPWRLEVRGGDGVAAWLAGRAGRPAGEPAPDPAQLDLWAAAWLLADPSEDHAAAQALRQAMGLRLGPLAYPDLRDRLAECTRDPALADRLVNRLARSQTLDPDGLPQGDGYFTRALDFWERRLEAGIEQPAIDEESRARLQIDRARLRLWRDPKSAAQELIGLAGGRNQAVIRGGLTSLFAGREGAPQDASAVTRRRPTWRWQQLPRQVQFRLRSLGIRGPGSDKPDLRLGVRHHLALALLLGAALGGVTWSAARFLAPEESAESAYQVLVAGGYVIEAHRADRAWLGSPWYLTRLPALGPLQTPYRWSWEELPVENPQALAPDGEIWLSGTQAFPIRGCGEDWPERSLALIQARSGEAGARKLAIRLLDRGAADRVLVAPDWGRWLERLVQGIRRADDQLLVFIPRGAAWPTAGYAEGIGRLAEIRGEPETLAAGLNFHQLRPAEEAWPDAEARVLAGDPKVRGGPEFWTDGATGTVWVKICGGTFSMGSPASESRYLETYAQEYVDAYGGTLEVRKQDWKRLLIRERPRHTVLLDDFWITRTEMTRGQYRALGREVEGDSLLPVADLDWETAKETCEALMPPPDKDQPADNDQRKSVWNPEPSLAFEAQWEYAARAGTASRWSFDDARDSLDDFAWYRANAQDGARPVGGKRPNGLCLADMHGNVWEWVGDCFAEDAYRARDGHLTLNPRVVPSTCDTRVVRGGSFGDPPVGLRSARRFVVRPGGRAGHLGLRCVRSRVRQP